MNILVFGIGGTVRSVALATVFREMGHVAVAAGVRTVTAQNCQWADKIVTVEPRALPHGPDGDRTAWSQSIVWEPSYDAKREVADVGPDEWGEAKHPALRARAVSVGHEIAARWIAKEVPDARFTVKDGLIFFESRLSGSYATMFAPDGNKLVPRGDRSSASDAERRYVWAFEWGAPLVEGAVFVFATKDRDVSATVSAGALEVTGPAAVKRYPDGNPWELVVARPTADAPATTEPGAAGAPKAAAGGGIPPGARAIVNLKGTDEVEVRAAGGKLLYTLQPPMPRAFLAPDAVEVAPRGADVEWEYETGDAP